MDDKKLRDDVIEELDWQPGLDSTAIGVLVDDGVVTLTGHVCSYAERLLAESLVKRMRGVRAVVQEINVHPDGADADEAIADRAVRMLDWDARIPSGSVKVRVARGVVTLSGVVDGEHQRLAADDAVQRLPGVMAVVNQITLRPKAQVAEVSEQIRAALDRYAEDEARNVKVTVAEGRVTLEGSVSTSAEREIVERAARSARGVREVIDRLRVGR